MPNYVTITKSNIDDYLEDHNVVVFSLRNSRVKAKQLAIMEAFMSLTPVQGVFIQNGPLGDVKGIFSFLIPVKHTHDALKRLPVIGYCDHFYILDFNTPISENHTELTTINELIWKGRRFSIRPFYSQDPAVYEQHSPHHRAFKLRDHNNEIKEVIGYRGDGTEMGRRALPVEDARCLVNLSIPGITTRMLDPFAGGGGIIFSAKYINNALDLYSVDVDPVLAPGLEYYGAKHTTANSSQTNYELGMFDAIVTEVPFSPQATSEVVQALKHLYDTVNEDGRIVIMCGLDQQPEIEMCMNELGCYNYVNQHLDRKGTDVAITAWFKSEARYEATADLVSIVKSIY